MGECSFWYRPTRVVPDQRPLNGRCCNSCVHQVELLWRRAEGDAREVHSGKLYVLVSAELLDYDVSRRVEDSLEKHSHAVPGLLTQSF